MEHERSAIIELAKNGKTQKEILKLLNIPANRRKFVYRTIRRYNETGEVCDKARSGRPPSVTTPALQKLVRERIRRNPRRSMRKMAQELKVSESSVRKIVKVNLGMRSFRRKKVHFLSEQVKVKRLQRCKGQLRRHVNHDIKKIAFSDEKIFTIEEALNPQNDRIISHKSSTIDPDLKYVPRVQKPLSVMVWAGISAVGRTPLIFGPAGVKINSTTYRDLILEPIVKNLSQTMFNGGSFVFQQDGAPAHTSNVTQTWLQSNIPCFIEKEQWPPYSPDLNPMDYSVWSILESRVCAKSHKSIDSLKRKLREEWEKIPQDVLRAAVEALPGRISSVIHDKGGYIE
ncbi:hypothetical protein LOD99_1509 [Oopsacas minuta]|uniref:Tc1-like transposase DDE domain-containing protein n=1 Tax=Oopsacas minuta TaxID=111878 RepID=A0AAV7K5I3_9METZ|nr:hypothetical protein LOD99_1509 [Oopsacas minuta]